jgi:hypothetical protein
VALTPQQINDKWASNARNAVNSYKAGIQGVTEAPGIAAARNQDVMRQRILEAIDSGRWARRVSSVPLQTWQSAAQGKGATNYPGGIEAGKAKQLAFGQVFYPLMAQAKQAVRQMPNLTRADKLRRVEYIMEVGEQYKAQRGA